MLTKPQRRSRRPVQELLDEAVGRLAGGAGDPLGAPVEGHVGPDEVERHRVLPGVADRVGLAVDLDGLRR